MLGAMVDSLLGLRDDLNLLSDGEGSLLSVDHDLEALEIAEVGTGVSLNQLLCNGGSSPLCCETFLSGNLNEGASAAAALNGDLHPGE